MRQARDEQVRQLEDAENIKLEPKAALTRRSQTAKWDPVQFAAGGAVVPEPNDVLVGDVAIGIITIEDVIEELMQVGKALRPSEAALLFSCLAA